MDRLALLAALLPALLLASPRPARSEVEATPSSDVSAEFQQICQALRDSDDPYYGNLRLRKLEKAAKSGSARGREEELALAAALAREQLKAGQSEEALAALEAVESSETDGAEWARAEAWLRLLAHLQAAEDENCVLDHSAKSCILPIRDEAVHRKPQHAQRAAEAALAILEDDPNDIKARWLLNLSRMVTGEYPAGVPAPHRLPASALRSEQSMRPWRNRAPELGVNDVDLAGGAIMDDFDGDGLLDLVTSTSDPCDRITAYRNDGRGGFQEVAAAWELDHQLGGLNLVHSDYDGDGDLDLLVLRGAWRKKHGLVRNSLLRNDLERSGGFADVTRGAGLASTAYPTQTAAWADYDLDGDLDVYVGNEAEAGSDHPSQLFRNEGDGTFVDMAAQAGVENDRFAKGVTWGDFDDDGDPDLYVSNIGANRLYRNEGNGRFRDVAPDLGVDKPLGRSLPPGSSTTTTTQTSTCSSRTTARTRPTLLRLCSGPDANAGGRCSTATMAAASVRSAGPWG